jgi:hypothetical protein
MLSEGSKQQTGSIYRTNQKLTNDFYVDVLLSGTSTLEELWCSKKYHLCFKQQDSH